MENQYHLDHASVGGQAELFQFYWQWILMEDSRLGQVITEANAAVQKCKHDKPNFILDYLRERRQQLRAHKQRVNLWMQKNNKTDSYVDPEVLGRLMSLNRYEGTPSLERAARFAEVEDLIGKIENLVFTEASTSSST